MIKISKAVSIDVLDLALRVIDYGRNYPGYFIIKKQC